MDIITATDTGITIILRDKQGLSARITGKRNPGLLSGPHRRLWISLSL
jgi:hypothetical protein